MSVDAAAAGSTKAERIRVARGLLDRAHEHGLGGHRGRRGVEVAASGVLAVSPALARLFPGGGVRRGSTVALSGPDRAGAVMLELLAGASSGGGWCVAVGMPDLGVVAASEMGVVLERFAMVPRPGSELVGVVSALLDGVDLVAVAGCGALRPGDRHRLAARARARGSVLVAVGGWPGADLRVEWSAGLGGWVGLGGQGHGRLRQRRIRLRVRGREWGEVGRSGAVLLPGPEGPALPVESARAMPRVAPARRSA